jgi:DNA primase catalytic subunit
MLASRARWVGRAVLDEYVDDLQKRFSKALEDIILQYTYPRIDAEVSKHRNHLLKAPFCVHPGTGTCSSLHPSWKPAFHLPTMNHTDPSTDLTDSTPRPSLRARQPFACRRL